MRRGKPSVTPNTDILTKREIEIVELIRCGVSFRGDIAKILQVHRANVSVHLSKIMGKGVIKRTACGEYAIVEKPQAKPPGNPVRESSIAPIPLSRLMGAR